MGPERLIVTWDAGCLEVFEPPVLRPLLTDLINLSADGSSDVTSAVQKVADAVRPLILSGPVTKVDESWLTHAARSQTTALARARLKPTRSLDHDAARVGIARDESLALLATTAEILEPSGRQFSSRFLPHFVMDIVEPSPSSKILFELLDLHKCVRSADWDDVAIADPEHKIRSVPVAPDVDNTPDDWLLHSKSFDDKLAIYEYYMGSMLADGTETGMNWLHAWNNKPERVRTGAEQTVE